MEGQKILNSLSMEVKEKLVAKYGSLQLYYNNIIELNKSYYKAFLSHDEQMKARYEKVRFDYAHELETWGVIDGLDVFDAIAGDGDENIFWGK